MENLKIDEQWWHGPKFLLLPLHDHPPMMPETTPSPTEDEEIKQGYRKVTTKKTPSNATQALKIMVTTDIQIPDMTIFFRGYMTPTTDKYQ